MDEVASVTAGEGVRQAFTTFFDFATFDRFPRLKLVLLECGAVTVLAPAPNGQLLPTREFDAWIRRPAVERWLLVARAWLDSDRLFSRSAQPDSHPLGPEADLPYAATLRRLVVTLLLETS